MRKITRAVRSPVASGVGLATAVAAILWMAVPAGAAALTTERVSVSSSGEQGNGDSFTGFRAISRDGRFVAFASFASNLVTDDTNGFLDVFRRDRITGQTVRASLSSGGEQGNADSAVGSLSTSGDGNLVAFDSEANNLVLGDTNRAPDVFVRNVSAGTTIRASVTSSGKQGRGASFAPFISDDGRFVAFVSEARLVPEDTNRAPDVYLHDLLTGQTSLVSVSSGGQPGNDDSFVDDISGDGRFVSFFSFASNLVSGDTNDAIDVFVRDTQIGQTTRVSVSSSGQEGDADSFASVITPDGRFVAFTSVADNLVRNDRNGFADAFVRDLKTGRTTLVSKSSTGEQGNDDTFASKGISADGRLVAYRSFASNLVPDDTNGVSDVFLTDRSTGQTIRASVSATGEQGNDESFNAGISDDGKWVLFGSAATNLVDGDTNGADDVFVRGPFGSDISSTSGIQGPTASAPRVRTAPSRAASGRCDLPAAWLRYLTRLAAREGCQ